MTGYADPKDAYTKQQGEPSKVGAGARRPEQREGAVGTPGGSSAGSGSPRPIPSTQRRPT